MAINSLVLDELADLYELSNIDSYYKVGGMFSTLRVGPEKRLAICTTF